MLHKMRLSMLETMAVVLFAVLLCVSATGERAFAAGLPPFDSVLNDDDIRTLTKKYDKDGYELFTKGLSREEGLSVLVRLFYFTPETTNIDAIDTYVHEAYHKCARLSSDPTLEGKEHEKMKIYVGDGNYITVRFTKIFRSQDIAESIPQRFHRSNRFVTYVEDAGGELLSDWDGVYGLMNEFGGYCWGMHNVVSMFGYRDRFADTEATWKTFVSQGESNRAAYAEFRYYILHYLRYAREHRPAIYKKILKNQAFRKAYTRLDARFTEDIKTYEKDLKLIDTRLKRAGSSVRVKDMVSKSGVRSYYNSLQKETAKKTYREIEELLRE